MAMVKKPNEDAEREAIVIALRNLTESEGWACLLKALNFNLEQYQKAINDTNSDLDEKQQWRLKVKRELTEQLLDLPDRLAKDLEENVPGHDGDPFD